MRSGILLSALLLSFTVQAQTDTLPPPLDEHKVIEDKRGRVEDVVVPTDEDEQRKLDEEYEMIMGNDKRDKEAKAKKAGAERQSEEQNAKRISLIVGFGMNNATSDIFLTPTIDEIEKVVRVELDKRFRANFSFGISYTFGAQSWIEEVEQLYRVKKIAEAKKESTNITGFSFCLFMNPAILGNIGNNSINNPADLGFGLGYRWGHLSAFATFETFRLVQPRPYFITEYYGYEKPYVVGDDDQTMIATTNDRIFAPQWYTAVGFKVCYTLNILKNAQREVQPADS